MGETLGIAHNVFEKMERERDRKERIKKYEEWQKVKVKKQQKLKVMKAKIRVNEELRRNDESQSQLSEIEAEAGASGGGTANRDLDEANDLGDDSENEIGGESPTLENSLTNETPAKRGTTDLTIENKSSSSSKSTNGCSKCLIQ
ncbi:hypothetical protein TCAL_16259 [Tigriopus californicus]|uniref:Uncharacterized protein n=1 Tax=Tigriopus californicus TaxID=6832 RepID=A0A553N908_TIGCA|nr:hypothetical protein TCAL_16259 [Tigriopus californicus]